MSKGMNKKRYKQKSFFFQKVCEFLFLIFFWKKVIKIFVFKQSWKVKKSKKRVEKEFLKSFVKSLKRFRKDLENSYKGFKEL